jgi:ribosomal protein S3
LQTLKIGLNYTLSISFTKFGIISIKVWLLHADQYL